jgi:hypothetical protein
MRELGSYVRRGVLVLAATLAAVAAGTLPDASASGHSKIVVTGTAMPPGNRAQMTVVGCDDIFQRGTTPLRPTVGLTPGAGGTGRRSLGFDTDGGTAVGVVSYVGSVAATTVAGLSVRAESGASGVAYVGYQAPSDAGTSLMWIGRLPLTAPASDVWQPTDDVPGMGFAWTQYDMATGEPVGGVVGTSGVPAFVQAMGGDGYGFYLVGFGCDGNPFNLDAWRIGTPSATTTYDFEGYAASVTGGADATITNGDSATLTAQVTSDGAAPRLVLEERTEDGWAAAARQPKPGESTVTVSPAATTTYRWKIYSTPMVEAIKGHDQSAEFTITVAGTETETEPEAPAPAQEPDRSAQAPAKATPTSAASTPAAPAPAAPAATTPPAADPPAADPPAADPATPDPTPASTEPAAEPAPEPTASEPAEAPAG